MSFFLEIVINFIRFGLSKVKFFYYKSLWRKYNKHNFTFLNSIFDFKKVKVGNYTYGPLNILCWNDNKEFLSIGSYCSIASGVTFILGGNHNMNGISTFPFKYFFLNDNSEARSKGQIFIEDDVWIGTNAMIFSGITIGQGSVIAAGAVVTKSFPPYSLIGGNPARLIRRRFDNDMIEIASSVDYNYIDESFIVANMELFNKESVDINDLIKLQKKQ